MSAQYFCFQFSIVIALSLCITIAHANRLQGLDSSRSNPELVAKAILNTDHSQLNHETVVRENWMDEQHHQARGQLGTWAHHIDDWFGEPDDDKPASAKVRAILDQSWSPSDGYKVKPRIRGSIKLPTLEKRLSLVFGDEHLEDEFQQAAHLRNTPMPLNEQEKNQAQKDTSRNQSLALRLSKQTKRLGLDTDLDVGIRSGNDVYLRGKVGKDWSITDTQTIRAEQIVRYGSDSQLHVRTNLEWRKQIFEQHFWSNQLHIGYEDDNQDLGLKWGNHLFAEHSFFKNQRLSYGISTNGSEKKQHLNSYGPFVSWRQPVWRDWFFMQGDVNYQNDRNAERGHEIGTFMRMEAIF